MGKMLDVHDVTQLLKVAKTTAYSKIREINEKRNCKILRGRVSESAIRKEYGLGAYGMLDVNDVKEIFNTTKKTAYAIIRKCNENRNYKIIEGRVPEVVIKKEYGLIE